MDILYFVQNLLAMMPNKETVPEMRDLACAVCGAVDFAYLSGQIGLVEYSRLTQSVLERLTKCITDRMVVVET